MSKIVKAQKAILALVDLIKIDSENKDEILKILNDLMKLRGKYNSLQLSGRNPGEFDSETIVCTTLENKEA